MLAAATAVAIGCAVLAAPSLAAPLPYDLIVADRDAGCEGENLGKVLRVDLDGAVSDISAGGMLGDPVSIAVAPDGVIYVADTLAFDSTPPDCSNAVAESLDGPGGIVEIDPVTGIQSEFAKVDAGNAALKLKAPRALVLAPSGEMLVGDAGACAGMGGVVGIDMATRAQREAVCGGAAITLTDIAGMAFGADGRLFMTLRSSGMIVAAAVPPPGEAPADPVSEASGSIYNTPTGIVARPDGKFYVSNASSPYPASFVLVFDPDAAPDATQPTDATAPAAPAALGCGVTSNPDISPYDRPSGLALGPQGQLYVADPEAARDGPASGDSWCEGSDHTGGIFRLSDTGDLTAFAPMGNWMDPVAVAVFPNRPPVLDLVLFPNVPTARREVTFDASASADPDGGPLRFQWDLDNDGSLETDTGDSPIAKGTFDVAGKRRVGLLVSDAHGASTFGLYEYDLAEPPGDSTPPPAGPEPVKPPLILSTTIDLPGVRNLTVDQIIRNGLTLNVTCTEDCTLASQLLLDRASAKKLGIVSARRQIVIGSGKARLKAGVKGKLKIRLTRKAKRRLRVSSLFALIREAARRKIRLTLRTTSRYRSGRSRTSTRKISLRR